MAVSRIELDKAVYSVSAQARIAGVIRGVERLELKEPRKPGDHWRLYVITPSGGRGVTRLTNPGGELGKNKTETGRALEFMLRALLAANHNS